MKKCPVCKRPLPAERFYTNAGRDDGLSVRCKDCYRAYEATPDRRAKRTWNTINARAGKQRSYEHVEVRMTREEFLEWAIPQYRSWESKETPSLDRIDPSGHYEIGNLRVISRRINQSTQRTAKNWRAAKGTAWCSSCKKYLPTENFWRCAPRPNGLQSRCKPCQKQAILRYSGDVAL